jgi:extracellular elastinolytic metalloproteinase
VTGKAGGIRQYPYDEKFPDDFGDLGTGRYTECHNIGEIWCATLMEMTRNIGKSLAAQLVVDALKLTPANPSFLDARDAILEALENMRRANKLGHNYYVMTRNAIWKAFARFGMGPNARSNGAQLSGIQPDFGVPLETLPEIVHQALFERMVD